MVREETKKQLNEIKEENKCLGDVQENTDMMEIMKTTQDLKNRFSRKIEIFRELKLK